jgi:ABC-type sugar transport system ATPase subunit
VAELAAMLGIDSLLDRMPHRLSGGEAQRVALGRALAYNPDVLCLDEPLSSLDRDTRGEMCDLLGSVQKQTGVTVLHVTHDPDEGRVLGDKLFRFVNGTIIQGEFDADTAEAVRETP